VTVRKNGAMHDPRAVAPGRPPTTSGRVAVWVAAVADYRWTAAVLSLGSLALYLLLGLAQGGTDSHYPIAQAFLHGRLYLTQDYPFLELVPRPGGGWYSPFPPLISVLMLPFAAVGYQIDTGVIAAVIGGISVGLIWILLGRLQVERVARLMLTVGWAFGSEAFWVAATGGQHLAPQIAAAALLLGAVILGLDRRAPFAAGLFIGLAAAARLPIGLALPFVAWLYRRGGWPLVLVGCAIPAALVGAYNMARFGSPFEFGYGLIRSVQGGSVLSEPWYSDGIDSVTYLPRGIYAMLFQGFDLRSDFPWITPNIGGASIVLTMPILLWVFEARGRLALAAALTAIVIMLPDLAHGNPGVAEMGYRFIVDALPLLWLLLGLAFRNGISRAGAVVLLIGIPINVWFSVLSWIDLPGP
jgi:Glycosyltransferase family 87